MPTSQFQKLEYGTYMVSFADEIQDSEKVRLCYNVQRGLLRAQDLKKKRE